MKISVLMSVYKEPIEWIRLSIDSILNQTFRDFEFIIICDNPEYTEGISLLKEYESKDKRIRLVFNEQNIGLTKSLNEGLRIATGEYIARMDADDISMTNRFEMQLSFLTHNPNVVACGSYIKVINAEGIETERRQLLTKPKDIRNKLIFSSPIVHPVSMFKRVINGNIVKYNEGRRYSQDYALWVSLAANYDLANVPEYLLSYRESQEQISSKNHAEQQLCARLNSEDAIKALCLTISDNDKNVLFAITREDNKDVTVEEIENSIYNLYKLNCDNKKVDIKALTRNFILIYCNYLPQNNPVLKSLTHFFNISLKTRSFSIYCLLSLINKYRLKYKS